MNRLATATFLSLAISNAFMPGCAGDEVDSGFGDDLGDPGAPLDLRGVRVIGAALSGEPATSAAPLPSADVAFSQRETSPGSGY